MSSKRLLVGVVAVGRYCAATLFCASLLNSALVMEPVFNRLPGTGPGPNVFPFYNPDILVGGVAYFSADEPGEIVTYPSGDPRDPALDTLAILNNTSYNITGLTLRIIGTATHTLDQSTIVRGPVDAFWDDVNGDGVTGLSDIFPTIEVSADRKEIRFSGGLIPAGTRFTDIHLAFSDSPPTFAGIDSTFEGELVPEPRSMILTGLGTFALLLLRLRKAKVAAALLR